MYVTGAYIIEQLAGLWEMIIELYTEFAYKHNITLFYGINQTYLEENLYD